MNEIQNRHVMREKLAQSVQFIAAPSPRNALRGCRKAACPSRRRQNRAERPAVARLATMLFGQKKKKKKKKLSTEAWPIPRTNFTIRCGSTNDAGICGQGFLSCFVLCIVNSTPTLLSRQKREWHGSATVFLSPGTVSVADVTDDSSAGDVSFLSSLTDTSFASSAAVAAWQAFPPRPTQPQSARQLRQQLRQRRLSLQIPQPPRSAPAPASVRSRTALPPTRGAFALGQPCCNLGRGNFFQASTSASRSAKRSPPMRCTAHSRVFGSMSSSADSASSRLPSRCQAVADCRLGSASASRPGSAPHPHAGPTGGSEGKKARRCSGQ